MLVLLERDALVPTQLLQVLGVIDAPASGKEMDIIADSIFAS